MSFYSLTAVADRCGSSQLKPEAGDVDRIAALEKEIARHDKELEKLNTHTVSIEKEVKELQDQIMAIGGTKLKIQLTKVTDIKQRIDLAADRLTKAQVAGNKADKDLAKFEKANEANTKALQETEEELAIIMKKLNDNQQASHTYRIAVAESRQLLDVRREELEQVKEELEEHKEAMKDFRKLQVRTSFTLLGTADHCGSFKLKPNATRHSPKSKTTRSAVLPCKTSWIS
jgi:structural maintenance of chromosome 4